MKGIQFIRLITAAIVGAALAIGAMKLAPHAVLLAGLLESPMSVRTPMPTDTTEASTEVPNPAEHRSFRGMRFGVGVLEQIHECPRLADGMYDRASGTMPSPCWESACFSSHDCKAQVKQMPAKINFFDQFADHGILPYTATRFEEDDGQLAELYFEISAAAFGSLEPLFRAKYGEPVIATDKPWQSKGGVRTSSSLRAWHWRGLRIVLQVPTKDIDTGVLMVITDALFDKQEQQRVRDAQQHLKELE